MPPGFVVTRNALDLFLQHADLKTLVQGFVSRSVLGENVDRAAEFDDLCRQIRIAPVPEPLTVVVAKMAEPLLAEAPGGVAVRSSGAHEDSATASFAGVGANHEQVMRRRQACEAELRQVLAKNEPDLVPRFEQLLDWVFFWLPALNDRAWASVARNRIHGLWTAMCRKLQAAGLVNTPTDMRYFTVDDLATIAQTGDIEEGRRIWQRRRLAYEGYDRLQPPLTLGKAPNKPANAKPSTDESAAKGTLSPPAEDASRKDGAEAVIQGRGCSPGRAKGIAPPN